MASVTYKRYNGTSWEEIIWANHLPLSGGTMKGPLTITGGDSATAGKIILTSNGQITDTSTATLFGRSGTNGLTLYCGHGSYALTLRGSATRPTYNGNDLALYNDMSGSYIPLAGTESLNGSIIPLNSGGALNLGSSGKPFGTVYANYFKGSLDGTATNATQLLGTGKASNGYNGVITAGSDGVAEMGKYIDFHATSTDTKDYDVRFVCPSLTTKVTVNLPSSGGTLALTSQLATFSYSSGTLTITKS